MTRLSPPTEEEIIARLRRGDVAFPPLNLTVEEIQKWVRQGNVSGFIDAVVCMMWKKKTFLFAAECKRLSTPKTVLDAARQVKTLAEGSKLLPLVVCSFLDEQALCSLEAQSVSGIDLCGNGVVIVPSELYVRRTGSPNVFRPESVIKNVYRKSSSIVARLFLAKTEFASVQDALTELTRRGGKVTLSTVSKVCKRLEEDLVIERQRDGKIKLRLIQPDKLLDLLVANYSPPIALTRVTGKLRGIQPQEFRRQLRQWAKKTGNQVTLSGTSSVEAYAVMARDGADEYYCSDVAGALRFLGDSFQAVEKFATVSFLEVRDDEVYFDRKEDLTASPVQTLLELSSGDKRDKETSDQVRKVILNGLTPSAR